MLHGAVVWLLVDAGGLDGFGQGHGRENGGEPPCQPRHARAWRAEEEHVWGRMPALPSILHLHCPPRGSMTTKLSLAPHEPEQISPLTLLSSSIHAWDGNQQARSRGNPCSDAHAETGSIHSAYAPGIGEELMTPMRAGNIF
jgi:hypothetical protein